MLRQYLGQYRFELKDLENFHWRAESHIAKLKFETSHHLSIVSTRCEPGGLPSIYQKPSKRLQRAILLGKGMSPCRVVMFGWFLLYIKATSKTCSGFCGIQKRKLWCDGHSFVAICIAIVTRHSYAYCRARIARCVDGDDMRDARHLFEIKLLMCFSARAVE